MLNIVIFGAPGSGKGTQSELIIKKYGLYHISTGEILRKEIERQTELGLIAKKYIGYGHLVPDQLVIDMFIDIFDKVSNIKGYIFDGFPRTISQAQALDALLIERNTSVVATFSLSVEEKELVNRLLKRGKSAGRSDDDPEIIKKRLDIYKERTEPLKEYYKKKGKLFKIEGNGSIEDVFEGITEVIDRLVY
ncbi:MAG: adenylate kinase [Dysgonamonadaceae bacterium]|jgi:adenylate kinase|nr:adenylate kinase [Dysgonamonadaceae bacterium]